VGEGETTESVGPPPCPSPTSQCCGSRNDQYRYAAPRRDGFWYLHARLFQKFSSGVAASAHDPGGAAHLPTEEIVSSGLYV
jgi:hypothetical protein